MSFDKLREALPHRDVWILVLDTRGINVWCSAGKGTFGTTELVNRIQSTGLARVISHRELILPQLAGPGVAAHEIKKLSGFKVIYGPIRSKDLPAFLENGFKATPEMRLKTFTARERIAVIPIELVSAMKVGVVVLPIFFLIAFLGRIGEGWTNAFHHGLFSVAAILTAILAGAVFTPLLLPWLPGRAFSVKGLSLGILSVLILLVFGWGDWITWADRLEILAWIFLIPAASAFLAMNFTGASTYTSLSGVRKEMRWAVPLQISACIVWFGLWVVSHFIV
jgi:acetyl-CoA decarbonylase/synthase complex subunit gamma